MSQIYSKTVYLFKQIADVFCLKCVSACQSASLFACLSVCVFCSKENNSSVRCLEFFYFVFKVSMCFVQCMDCMHYVTYIHILIILFWFLFQLKSAVLGKGPIFQEARLQWKSLESGSMGWSNIHVSSYHIHLLLCFLCLQCSQFSSFVVTAVHEMLVPS